MIKCDNLADAQDLAQEAMLAALCALKKGEFISSPKTWLTRTLEHKYCDMLRQKYRRPTVYCDMNFDTENGRTIDEDIRLSAESEAIRRELGFLSGIYRDTMVRFYMKGQSVGQISAETGASESAVKSRLFTGRNNLRKEFDSMENYSKHSYEPEKLYISASGDVGLNGEPFSLVKDPIRMNLLILAYEKPLTVTELAKAIGIPSAYIEPAVDAMVDGGIMKRTGNKVYTDFIIYSPEDKTLAAEPTRRFSDKNFDGFWSGISGVLDELREKPYYKRLNTPERMKLELYFAIKLLQGGFIDVRNKTLRNPIEYEDYPVRKDGSRWFCMGNRYPKNYDTNDASWQKYSLSGDYRMRLNDYKGCKSVMYAEFDSFLGETRGVYSSLLGGRCERYEELLKFLYAVYTESSDDFDLLDKALVQNTDRLCEGGFLSKENGKLTLGIPVLTNEEYKDMTALSDSRQNEIYAPYEASLTEIIRAAKLSVPPHLKSVPEFLRCLYSDDLIMMTLIEAREKGLFLNGADYKTPSAVLVIEKDPDAKS